MGAGKKGIVKEEKFDITLAAEKSNLNVVRKLLVVGMKNVGFSPSKTAGFEVSITEHCENVIRHAYNGGKGDMRIEAEIKPDAAKVKISDSGPEFNMFKQKLPDLKERITKGIGGKMGIRTILGMCDEVKYHRRNGMNENTFIVRGEEE